MLLLQIHEFPSWLQIGRDRIWQECEIEIKLSDNFTKEEFRGNDAEGNLR